MSNKKKIIIAVSSLFIVLLFVLGIAVNYFIKIEQNKPKCVNAETEQQVRYILNMPTEDISIELYFNSVWNVTSAFGHPQSVSTNEEGLYAFGHGTYDVPPPPEEYMDEEYLEFALWYYTHKTGEVLAIEEIEKLVTEGNIEKKAEIDAYYDWYFNGGGTSISNYAYEYNTSESIGGWESLTLGEQQAFIGCVETYNNANEEDFSELKPAQQQELMQAYIKEHGTNEQ